MKYLYTIIVLLWIGYAQIAKAQLYYPSTQQSFTDVLSVEQFLYTYFPTLQTQAIHLSLHRQHHTAHARHYTFQLYYDCIPLYNQYVYVHLNQNNQLISIKKEFDENNFSYTINTNHALAQWKNSHIEKFIQLGMFDSTLQHTAQFIIDTLHQESTILLHVAYWNKHHDYAISFDNEGHIVKTYDYARHVWQDTILHTQVFIPDPLTSVQQNYGGVYIDNNDAQQNWMTPAYQAVDIPARFDASTQLFVPGNYLVTLEDFESPTIPIATSTTSQFIVDRSMPGFEAANIVYHITAWHNYISLLGYDTLMDDGITVDPQGQFGADNSVFLRNGGSPTLSFGTGGVDDAEDADVIIHEYTHGLSWSANGNDNFGNERAGLDEGIADYFATSYSRSISNFQWQQMFSWDGHNTFWAGRTATSSAPYGSSTNIYTLGEMWNSAMSRIWGDWGAAITDQLMLESMHFLSNQTTLPEAALYMLAADTLLFNGIHASQICNRFQEQSILDAQCKPVYIPSVIERNSDIIVKQSLAFAQRQSPLIVESHSNNAVEINLTTIDGKHISRTHLPGHTQWILSPDYLATGMYLLHIQCSKQAQNKTYKIALW